MKPFLILCLCTMMAACSLLGQEENRPEKLALAQLRSAPDTLALGGQKLVLDTFLWRDFQPIAPPDGEPLIGIFRVYSADSTALPEDFAVEAAWLVDGTEIWATYFTGEEPPESEQQPYLWYEVARRGPKWGPGITVDAVVRIRNADGVAYLLRAPGQQIWRTD
jgi:hypothetical protein